MATVLEIVTDSLRQIGVIGQTKTPSAEQGADAVAKLNDLMQSLQEDEIDLGWGVKASTASTYVLPLGLVEGIKAMLAMKLAGTYGVEPPAVTSALAAAAYRRMLGQAIHAAMNTKRMTVLPQGSGQRGVSRIETDQ